MPNTNPQIILVAAMDKNRGIGKNGQLPWQSIPLDFQRFKNLSLGKPTIMGRKTFESVLGYFNKPLPNRTNIVVTSQTQNLKNYENVIWTNSIAEALEKAKEVAITTNCPEICVAGGSQIYAQTLDLADKLYLTIIDQIFDCDAFFPDYQAKFKAVQTSEVLEQSGYKFEFVDLEYVING
jgi:dihydrofolate reductase